MLLHGYGLSLALLAELLHDSNDTSIAEALEDKSHAIAALAELVDGLGGGKALNASLNALCTKPAEQPRQPAGAAALLGLAKLASEFLSEP